MAESSLDSLRQMRSIEVEWRAYELRPADTPPIPPDAEAAYRKRIDLEIALGQQLLEARVFVDQPFEFFGVTDRHALIAPAPPVEGDLIDTMLTAHFRDGLRAGLGLAKNGDNLLGGELFPFHQDLLVEILAFYLDLISGGGTPSVLEESS